MNHHFHYLQKLLLQNGPNPEDYNDLDAWLIELADDIAQPTNQLIEKLLSLFGEAFPLKPCRALSITNLMDMPVTMK